jgi:RNA polymerase sigma factor for flagellar operon FliA
MPRKKIKSSQVAKERRITTRKKIPLSPSALGKRNALVEQYYGYVDLVVSRLIRSMRLPPPMKEEFISAGLFGLIEAAGRFKPERGLEFKTFAFLRIKGAVIDYIRTSCDLTGYAYRRLRALEVAQQLREGQLEGRMVSRREDKQDFEEGVDYLERMAVVFRLAGQSEEEAAAGAPEQEALDPELNLEKRRTGKKIREIVATLPEKERIIIEQHYFQDRKLVDVAEQFAGLSKSWVSRLHDRAIEMLREKIVATAPDMAA